jgi:2-phospho-L-lactate transferase/gluconeogenesis factor (CofD/UPF0052 family)
MIVALAGGVGGAKLAHGLALARAPEELTVIVNTGDDFDHYGLRICPDLDTVLYTLAGLANERTGWGVADDTSAALAPEIAALGIQPLVTQTIMRDHADRERLARETLDFAASLRGGQPRRAQAL